MKSTDIIYLRELKIYAQIGHFEWEQRIKQPVIFNIELTTDVSLAAKSSNLAETIDYVIVAKCVEDFVTSKAFHLLETLVEEVAALILQEFRVSSVRIGVCKFAILPNAKEAGIIIERCRINDF